MDERIIVAIVYILAGITVIMFRPECTNLYVLIATPVLNYFFTRSVMRRVEKKPFHLVSDLLLFVACLLIVAVVAMLIAPLVAGIRL